MQNQVFKFPKLRNKNIWGQLTGASLSLAIAELYQNEPGAYLIIAKDNLHQAQLKDEIAFFLNDKTVIHNFPDWEILPYDYFSPHQDIISERLQTLYNINLAKNNIIISSPSTLMHRLCPVEFLHSQVLILEEGQSIDLTTFKDSLIKSGYIKVNQVFERGEFAIRGSLIDLFPMGSKHPIRIELFDDAIESLRLFSEDTQRTITKTEKINILPAREFPVTDESISLFRQQFRQMFDTNPQNCPIYTQVSDRQLPQGIEYYLPLFFQETATIFDYLPENTKIITVDNISDYLENFASEANKRFTDRNFDVTRPVLPPQNLFLNPAEFLTNVNNFINIRMHQSLQTNKTAINFNLQPKKPLPAERLDKKPLIKLKEYIESHDFKCLVVAESKGRHEVLNDLLRASEIHAKQLNSWNEFITENNKVNLITAPLLEGVELLDKNFSIITEDQLFGEHKTLQQRRTTTKSLDPDTIIRSLHELSINSPVVHIQHGVGRYLGLTRIESQGQFNEFLILQYQDNARIYVPVTALHLINRYTGSDSEHAPIHKLGSTEWQKSKKKALEKIHDVAAQLLEIYAKRELKKGFAFKFDKQEYQSFAEGFPFTETPDQIKAIEEIIKDMQSERAMDRLICGDVGFGKTEVAMRAAFIAVNNNKQVCILVPTTLLASQHYNTLKDRFAGFAVRIALLSRFRTEKESTKILQDVKDHKVDIVVGTHKLLQKNIEFKDLGLLIIDEEHRFGVKQKEHIKKLRANVDILSMTATPIPRTLNMAMSGIRDISIIATPPQRRLAIKTFWQEKNKFILREAMLREILRGGQVFYLHNNVTSIENTAKEIQALVPEAKVKFAHGQMRERELEKIMSDFYHHHFNVLVCTTIIETGIDIPSANTIVIDRADKFGLAQLHQLRGRVGRSHHQAYAYLLTPNEKLLTKDSKKRLEAICSLEELGSGFTLATHDLEIRGAGELLGEEQSGNITAIGFTLYMDMLEKAVNDLKSGKILNLSYEIEQETEIDLKLSAIIPEEYIGDVHLRLIFYKRIANAKNDEELKDLQIELIDRFGLYPTEVKNLFLITRLKIQANKMGIKRINSSNSTCNIEFGETTQINTKMLVDLIQKQSTKYKLKGPTILTFDFSEQTSEKKINEISELLDNLSV